ncbi:uncharacterized protein LOC116120347 [Pistacia vera]|uniref:uncharacterized protein LOC116120347 n=1 Tax=Pistacia vera TaxID=55513 RepID=UPI001263852F|nr:uncharacterized protein LOC116120347 [Pistacia vera]
MGRLRALVYVSLTCQILLIVLGNRRKCIPRIWIKAVVWSAYLLADSVATIALGILLNDLGEIYHNRGHADKNTEVTAFWAPFFLLHLGGPDTITAYALEDNELFLRHAFQLIVQTLATILIFLTAWNGSHPSRLAIPMIIVGFIKYAERTLTLWLASSNRLRDSMLSPPEAGPNYHRFMHEYCLKHAEGYMLKTEEMPDAVAITIDTPESQDNFTSDDKIKHAHALFQLFKRLLADLILSNQERETSQSLFHKMKNYKDVFDVIAIELGFMYDLLYTKATIITTVRGLACRFISTLLTCVVLGIFYSAEKQNYQKVDIYITYSLLWVAIGLEIYAALVLVLSDQSRIWFIKHKEIAILLKPIQLLEPVIKPSRWSNLIAQYSFTRHCFEERPGYYKVLKHIHVLKLWEKHQYNFHIQLPEDLKEMIFKHVKSKLEEFEKKLEESEKRQGNDSNLRDLNTRGSRVLKKYNELIPSSVHDLEWSVKDVEFDQSILIWHIATELCCVYSNNRGSISADIKKNCDMSSVLSNYMMYLLVMYPSLLPVGIGLIRLQDTREETMKFLKERGFDKKKKIEENKNVAWNMLLGVKTHVKPIKVKGDRCKSVLFDACSVASVINGISEEKVKWEMVRDVWLEMLTYAASEGRGSEHGSHLRRGGELLTHVWLLMANFGISEQFQISKGHARAYLIAK